jgi:hypothetical protein
MHPTLGHSHVPLERAEIDACFLAPHGAVARTIHVPTVQVFRRLDEIAGGEHRGCSRLWRISLEADSSDGGLGGGNGWAERGMVREAVWKTGKRVERSLDVCFGGWVKGDKASGVAAGRWPT